MHLTKRPTCRSPTSRMQRMAQAGRRIMADFTDGFWGAYIAVLTLLGIAGCAVLLWAQSKSRVDMAPDAGGQPHTTGHSWDEGLSELNNPMPRWWMWLFYITIVFGLAYLF